MKKLNTHTMNIKITGVGSYMPKPVQKNEAFPQHSFVKIDGAKSPSPNQAIVQKFKTKADNSERGN